MMSPTGRHNIAPNRTRDGFTLVEVLLVLTVLVIISALAWPALRGPLDNLELRQAAESVRVVWSDARLQAMTTGQIHVFRYQPLGGQYQVEAWTGIDAALEASDAETPLVETLPGKIERLPEGVWFAGGLTDVDRRAEQAAANSLEAESATGPLLAESGPTATAEGDQPTAAWTTPILFYPDGTTSTAQITLQNEFARFVTLRLRGLTGASRASDLQTHDEVARAGQPRDEVAP